MDWLKDIERSPGENNVFWDEEKEEMAKTKGEGGKGKVVENWVDFTYSLPGCIPFVSNVEKDVEKILRKMAEEMIKLRLQYIQKGNTPLHTACFYNDRGVSFLLFSLLLISFL